MSTLSKITEQHLSRNAYVYLRQSTPAQVRFHRESTERQYNLVNKAQVLGWRPEQIRVLDGDLGQSAATNRGDFKILVGDVAMGQVGAIFSLEGSRLARSNQDWHRLLELSAITGTLVIDEDGCYDPADFNDSIVLGMKGTFAQAELHIIRALLHGGKLNKASRGELRFALPVGLIFEDHKIVLDPDREVQNAVRMIFALFEQEGTAYGVVRRVHERGLLFPRRVHGGTSNGKLVWGQLLHERVLSILANPCYAGAYAFGRYQSTKRVSSSGEIISVSRAMPEDAWRVLIRDHHAGYIDWDRFVANRQRLAKNRSHAEVLPGPVREGLCLLQGLLVCGVCGWRLSSSYQGNGGIYPKYKCQGKYRTNNKLRNDDCLEVSATPLDKEISDRLVSAITPVTIELALAALTSLEDRDREVGAQWRMRLERARYDADLAEQRYEAVDPTNRLIAATLESRWNDAVQRLHDLEAEVASFERKAMRTITAEQKRQIVELAGNFPELWAASTTTPRDRKRMLRLLVRDITVTKSDEPKIIRLHIRWQGGETETLQVHLPPNRADAVRYPEAFVARVRELAVEHHDEEIVNILRTEGRESSTKKSLTVKMIRALRYKHHIAPPQPPEGAFEIREVCERYGVSRSVVQHWIYHGIIEAQHRKPNTRYTVIINDKTDRHLRELVKYSVEPHRRAQTQTS
jgi:DNA invertase Pin-like site-specific DNA recombinase